MFSQMTLLTDKASTGSIHSVKVFEAEEWNGMTEEQQRTIFKENTVKVIGSGPSDVLPDVTDASCTKALGRAVDMDKQLYCHGE